MNAKRAAKLMQIAHYYGEEKQVCKLMEELGEATSAASEVLMLLSYHEQGGKKRDLEARLEHLAAELAARPGRGTADLARDESRRLSRQTGKPQPVTGWGLRTINFIALP